MIVNLLNYSSIKLIKDLKFLIEGNPLNLALQIVQCSLICMHNGIVL